MKPTDLIASQANRIDLHGRILAALEAHGSLSQSALALVVKATSPASVVRYRACLDDLASQGRIEVWREVDSTRPGRPAVRVRLASREPPAAS